MLKFYYSKGSSSLAAHILLEEVGAHYEAIEVPIARGAQHEQSFLDRAPKGRIPVLETPFGILSENPAILEYVAQTHPHANLWPSDPWQQARARSLAAYLCATVHVAFAHSKRAARWATDADSLNDMQSKAPENLRNCALFLEADLQFDPWCLGDSYSFCDPYLFLLGGWLSGVGETLTATPKLAAHHAAMMARPATRKVMARLA